METTKEFYRTGNYEIDHTTFGGVLNSFDFDGHHNMKTMSDKIISDLRFDKQCKKNEEERNRRYKYRKENE